MSANQPIGTPVHMPIAEMFDRFLKDQLSAQDAGFPPTTAGEVVPHEAGAVQAVDPRLAWDGATAALGLFHKIEPKALQRPEDWASLVMLHEPAAGLAFAAGNFPQLVRNLQPLLQATDLTALRPGKLQPIHAASLLEWATHAAPAKLFPQPLLALGVLRLARQFDAADKLLRDVQATVPAAWRNATANEEAALAWHAGRADEAIKLWQAHPESVPVLFNRGMAALFSGRHADARTPLRQAVQQLPESGAWHHLGCLYLALAEAR